MLELILNTLTFDSSSRHRPFLKLFRHIRSFLRRGSVSQRDAKVTICFPVLLSKRNNWDIKEISFATFLSYRLWLAVVVQSIQSGQGKLAKSPKRSTPRAPTKESLMEFKPVSSLPMFLLKLDRSAKHSSNKIGSLFLSLSRSHTHSGYNDKQLVLKWFQSLFFIYTINSA